MTSMMGRERNGLLACLFALLCAFALPQPQAEAAGRVEAVAVTVVGTDGEAARVRGPLAAGDRVVALGTHLLVEDMAVRELGR